jgi:hypothetical protein
MACHPANYTTTTYPFRLHCDTRLPRSTCCLCPCRIIFTSAPVVVHQARLRIQQLKRFFPLRRKVQSQISNPKSTETWQCNITGLAALFSTRFISWSTVRKKNKEITESYNTPTMSSFYDPKVSTSRLPTIDEDTACKTTSPQRRQSRWRKLNCSLFTDHLGYSMANLVLSCNTKFFFFIILC